MLGGYISNNLKWNEHIRGSNNSMFKTLISRINALRKISKISSFKTRNMIANGVVISKLIYLIQVWGGCPNYLLGFLQTLQNRAARIVCNGGRYTPVQQLLDNCGWMSVRQLSTIGFYYHTKYGQKRNLGTLWISLVATKTKPTILGPWKTVV